MGTAQKNAHHTASDFYSTYRYRVSKVLNMCPKLYSSFLQKKKKYNSSMYNERNISKKSMNSKYLYIHTTL